MTLKCSLCGHSCNSLLIADDERALNEISQSLAAHLKECHTDIALGMGKTLINLTSIIPWLLVMKFAIFQDEAFIKAQWQHWVKTYFEQLGIVAEPKKEADVEVLPNETK